MRRAASKAIRSRAARRGWAQRGDLIDHILTVEVASPDRRGQLRRTTRDLVVPARRGTRQAELIWLAHKYQTDMPVKDRYAVDLLSKRYAERYTKRLAKHITVAEGPPTRARKVKLR